MVSFIPDLTSMKKHNNSLLLKIRYPFFHSTRPNNKQENTTISLIHFPYEYDDLTATSQ